MGTKSCPSPSLFSIAPFQILEIRIMFNAWIHFCCIKSISLSQRCTNLIWIMNIWIFINYMYQNMNWNDGKFVCVRFVVSTFKCRCICTKSNSNNGSKYKWKTPKNHAHQRNIIWKCLLFGSSNGMLFIDSRAVQCSLFKMLDLLNFWCFSIWS